MLARFAHLPRRSTDTWQGGILRMPMWVDGPMPQSYAMGSREEAVICVGELGDAWKATSGALQWLATHAPAGKRRKRHRR